MKRLNIILVFLLTIVFCSYAGMGTEGTVGMQFLTIGPDARGVALSGAVIGDTGGVKSIYWNPAGLNTLQGKEILFTYTKWIADMNYLHIGFGTSQLKIKGNTGISLTYFGEGDITKIGIEDTRDYGLSSSDLAINFAYATPIKKVDFGAGLKLIQKSLFGKSSFGVALDIGAQMSLITLKGDIKLGAVLKNIGFASAAVSKSDILPMMLQLGGVYKYYLKNGNKLNALLSADFSVEQLPLINLGVEYVAKEMVFIRGGYSITTGKNRAEGYSGISFGLGVVSKKMSIDFSIMPMGILGNAIQATVGVKF